MQFHEYLIKLEEPARYDQTGAIGLAYLDLIEVAASSSNALALAVEKWRAEHGNKEYRVAGIQQIDRN